MKNMFLTFIVFMSASAIAETFKIEDYDQQKLAALMTKIPKEAKVLKVTEITEPMAGRVERVIFPRWVGALKIICESTFYDEFEIAAKWACTMEVNSHHDDVEAKYDEFKILLKNPKTTKALFESISFGRPEKDFRSFKKDPGMTFEGKITNIFHYFFKCSESLCDLRVSKKIQE